MREDVEFKEEEMSKNVSLLLAVARSGKMRSDWGVQCRFVVCALRAAGWLVGCLRSWLGQCEERCRVEEKKVGMCTSFSLSMQRDGGT